MSAAPHGRPLPSLSAALSTLAAVTSGERPAWCSAALWRDARRLVATARADLRAAVPTLPSAERWAQDGHGERLGVGRSTLARWLAGWLR